MMVVRADQLERLAGGAWAAQRHALVTRLIHETSLPQHDVEPVVARALTLAELCEIERPEHLEVVAELMVLAERTHDPDRWLEVLERLVANVDAKPAARVSFLQRELRPRLEAEQAS